MLACRSLERAIRNAVPDRVEFRIGPDGIAEPPERSLSTVRSALAWWRSNRPGTYADAELLVCSSEVDWNHGGVAARIGGPVGVAGYGDWMDEEQYRRIVLHEVGHCLGMRHAHGRRWSSGDEAVATPMVPAYPDRTPLRFADDASSALHRYLDGR